MPAERDLPAKLSAPRAKFRFWLSIGLSLKPNVNKHQRENIHSLHPSFNDYDPATFSILLLTVYPRAVSHIILLYLYHLFLGRRRQPGQTRLDASSHQRAAFAYCYGREEKEAERYVTDSSPPTTLAAA